MQQIDLGDITIEVLHKNIKNLHLSVSPPTGKVKISVPLRMDLETIRMYAISKLPWIKSKQSKLQNQEREAPREFLSRESHYYLGKRYLLIILVIEAPPTVTIEHDKIVLKIRKSTTTEQRQIILQEWYRTQLKKLVPKYISIWEEKLKLKVEEFGIKKMKTKWGTCNIEEKRIWINLELAKKPTYCLEYIVVHEMLHLIERHHNERFTALLDKYLPQWKNYKEELNRLPVSHVSWNY